MVWKRRMAGGLLAVVGFMLSPLSWWNDAFVNLPLALGFAWLVSSFCKPAFEVSLVVGYWLTNVLGFVLMHAGARKAFQGGQSLAPRREILLDVGISLLYTTVIIALIKTGVLKPIQNYFSAAG